MNEIKHDGYRLIVRCDMNVDHLPGDMTVTSFGPRTVCMVRDHPCRRAAELAGVGS
jgi:hypothetical protein